MRYKTVTVGFDGPVDHGVIDTAAAVARAHSARLVVAVAYDRGGNPGRGSEFRDSLGFDSHAIDPAADSEHHVHDLATGLRSKYGLDVVERFTPRPEMYERLMRDAEDHNLVIVPSGPRGFSAGRSLGRLRKHDNVLVVAPEHAPAPAV
ncbi:MAG: hypothetical protein QM658_15070 [Gordonia sp. (in: high G+C Gram-positive bacteria)]